MNKGIKLWSINKVLRKINLVLVIMAGQDADIRLWFERASTYDQRCAKQKS